MKRSLAALVIIFSLTLGLKTARGEVRYRLTDLGSLWTDTYLTQANDINNDGRVVGNAQIFGFHVPFRTEANQPINPASDNLFPPFNYDDPSTLYATGVRSGNAKAINDSGQVVGSVQLSKAVLIDNLLYVTYHAYRHSGTGSFNLVTDDLGTLGGAHSFSEAFDINNSGQVVGWSQPIDGPGYEHAFRTAANQPINPATDDLGTFGGKISAALGINDSEQVVGYAYTSDGNPHAFLHSGNGPLNPATDDLGTFGGSASRAVAINDTGQVVGDSRTLGDHNFHAFVHRGNGPLNPVTDDLGTLGGTGSSSARAINNAGQVVGNSEINGMGNFAFLYDGSGVMQNLNDLIEPSSGWQLRDARGINDFGLIVGYGITPNGHEHAFLLTPIPEPSSVLLLGIGAISAVAYVWRQRWQG